MNVCLLKRMNSQNSGWRVIRREIQASSALLGERISKEKRGGSKKVMRKTIKEITKQDEDGKGKRREEEKSCCEDFRRENKRASCHSPRRDSW